jgi:hypothetical protein
MNDQDGAAALDGDRCDVCGGVRGGSLELSLVLAPVVHLPRGLRLRDLQRTRILIGVLAVVGEVGHGLATKGRL